MKRPLPWLNIAIAVLTTVFWVATGSMAVSQAQECDFLSLDTGGRAVLSGPSSQLYKMDFQLGVQKGLLPRLPEFHPYIRPPLFAWLIAPLALLPLVPAFWIWLGLQVAVLLACWAWAYRRFGPDALVYCSFYLPAAYGIMHGQDNATMLALLIVVFVLAGREANFTAGATLGLGLIKFHLLALFPLVLLAGKRWRLLAGFSLVALLQAATSLWLVGPAALRDYYELLRHNDPAAVIGWTMISVPVLPLNFGATSPAWTAALVAIVIALVLGACRSAPLWRWFSAGAIGSVLISPHSYKYDATMLLLPVLLAIFESDSKFTRYIAATAVIPIPYILALLGPPFAAIPAVLLLVFLASLARENHFATKSVPAPRALAAGQLLRDGRTTKAGGSCLPTLRRPPASVRPGNESV